jgi:hypothetical protein
MQRPPLTTWRPVAAASARRASVAAGTQALKRIGSKGNRRPRAPRVHPEERASCSCAVADTLAQCDINEFAAALHRRAQSVHTARPNGYTNVLVLATTGLCRNVWPLLETKAFFDEKMCYRYFTEFTSRSKFVQTSLSHEKRLAPTQYF